MIDVFYLRLNLGQSALIYIVLSLLAVNEFQMQNGWIIVGEMFLKHVELEGEAWLQVFGINCAKESHEAVAFVDRAWTSRVNKHMELSDVLNPVRSQRPL